AAALVRRRHRRRTGLEPASSSSSPCQLRGAECWWSLLLLRELRPHLAVVRGLCQREPLENLESCRYCTAASGSICQGHPAAERRSEACVPRDRARIVDPLREESCCSAVQQAVGRNGGCLIGGGHEKGGGSMNAGLAHSLDRGVCSSQPSATRCRCHKEAYLSTSTMAQPACTCQRLHTGAGVHHNGVVVIGHRCKPLHRNIELPYVLCRAFVVGAYDIQSTGHRTHHPQPPCGTVCIGAFGVPRRDRVAPAEGRLPPACIDAQSSCPGAGRQRQQRSRNRRADAALTRHHRNDQTAGYRTPRVLGKGTVHHEEAPAPRGARS